jgi:hypothetical protein
MVFPYKVVCFISAILKLFYDGNKCCVYEESVVVSFKFYLLLMIFWFNIINYNS